MAPNSIFGRDDDQTDPPEPANEGVRLLGADEVARRPRRPRPRSGSVRTRRSTATAPSRRPPT